jgi:hypothetical protein
MNATRLLRSRAASAALAFILGGCLAAGVAFATIPDGTNGAITACYPTSGSSTGALRVINAQSGAHCNAGEATLTWPSHGFRWMGQWRGLQSGPPLAYRVNDIVSYAGSVYVAVKGNKNVVPTTAISWAVMAGVGAKGAPAATQFCAGYPHEGIDWSVPGSTPGNGCDFTGANMASRDLVNANLTNVNLTNVNLTGAQLAGANLTGATLTGVTWSGTMCPDGTFSDTNGTAPQSCAGHL